jgi:ferredoxin
VAVKYRTRATEVERRLEPTEARREGSRCLHCWVNTVFDSEAMNGSECIQCGGCVDVCPEQCLDLVSLARIAALGQGAALLKDERACIRCGLCARRCPTEVITMQAFFHEDEAALMRHADVVL